MMSTQPVSPDALEADSGHHAIHRMFRRDSLYTLGFVLQLAMGSIVTPILTRVLGAASYGHVAASIAVMQVLFTVEGLGLTTGILRITALEGIRAGRAVLGLSLGAAVATTALLLGTYSLWAQPLGFGAARQALLLTIMWSGLSACTSVSLALLRSADKLSAVLFVDAIQIGGAQALGLALAASSHNRVNAYLYGVEIAQAVALSVGLLSLPPARRLWRERAVLRRVLVFSLPVLPQLLSNFVLGTSDRLILGSDLGPVPVGRYQIAYGLACIALLMVGVLTAQWLPSLLRIRGVAARRQAISVARDRLGYMLIPVVLGLCTGLPALLRFWVSGEYHPAGLTTVVVTVAASTIPFTLYACHSLVLFIQGSTKLITVVNIVAALVNVGLNLVLVPSLRINGSAYATLVAYVVLWMAAALATRGSEIRPGPSRRIAGSVAVTSLLAGASVFVPVTGPAGVLRWIIAGGCVVAFAVMVKAAGRSLPAEGFDPVTAVE